MNWLHEWVLAPFVGFGFMRRALYGSFLLCLSACPVGVFLTLRRMSLVGDAMSHAILPGAAFGFLLYGLDILPMTIGGLVAGLIVAIFAGAVSRLTVQKRRRFNGCFLFNLTRSRRAHCIASRLKRGSYACPIWNCACTQSRSAVVNFLCRAAHTSAGFYILARTYC